MEVLTSKTWWGKLGGYFSIGPTCGAFATTHVCMPGYLQIAHGDVLIGCSKSAVSASAYCCMQYMPCASPA